MRACPFGARRGREHYLDLKRAERLDHVLQSVADYRRVLDPQQEMLVRAHRVAGDFGFAWPTANRRRWRLGT
jgi:hypothetical protein